MTSRDTLWRVLVAALIVLVGAEAGARAIASRLPEALVWHTEEAQAKVQRMDAIGGADLAFFGSSLVDFGIDPARVASHLPDGTTGYNAGLSAAVPSLTQPWASHVVIPRLQPHTVVFGIGSFDVSDHPSGQVFFSQFVASPAARQALDPGDHINNASTWLGERSQLWASRKDLRQPMTLIRAILGREHPIPAEAELLAPDGRTSYLEDQVFDPTIDKPSLPVSNWSIGNEQPAKIRELLSEARAQGIRAVLVAMPVTDAFIARHPNGEADQNAFLETARLIADEEGVDFLDMSHLRDPNLFVDAIHVNREGTSVLSDALGRFLASP